MKRFNIGKLHFSLFTVLCSLLIHSCANPLITQIAEPKTIIFDTNGGSQIDNQIVYRNYPIQRPSNPSKFNYTFENWYSENRKFETPWNFNNIPVTDIILYANWTPVYSFTVTFDKNGGDTDANPAFITVTPGTLITPPGIPPTKDGYGFAGWYREASCITEWNFSADIVTENITLYARWMFNCVIVILDMEEITGDQAPQIPAVTISRTGTGGLPEFYLVKIEAPNQFDAGSITWRISGVGAYAETFITDDNDPATGPGEFLLNANDTRYNAFGTHTLLLEVKKNGIAYQTNIVFTIIN